MRLVLISLIAFALLSSLGYAELNPKQVTEASFRITMSGSLSITGSVDYVNLSMYIPQDGVEDMKITADSWHYAEDEYGNRIVVLGWKSPAGSVPYKIETVVSSKAVFLASEASIGTNAAYLKENDQIRFTPEIRKAAFPYEKTLKRASELASWVHDYVHYDLSYVGQLKPSDWVYENRHGVCVEFANLLSALLKINGIPTRYVNGYAYSPVENKLVGHAWVEVLLSDGSWAPIDATWLQAGYIDATHIITSVRDDANQTQRLTYSGHGGFNVAWNRKEDETALLDYKTSEIEKISLYVTNVSLNGYGLAKAVIKPDSCTIAQLNITSCVDENGNLLNILHPQRNEWLCGERQVYWIYNVSSALKKGFLYVCPVGVYDQTGSQSVSDVGITENIALPEIGIAGPDTASVNEKFELSAAADGDFVFFSPELGESSSKIWSVSANKPGTYTFYLFSGGALATKKVDVAEEKEFTVSASFPKNISLNGTFVLNAAVSSLANAEKSAVIRVEFSDAITEKRASFAPGETRTIGFNMTAPEKGLKKITVSVLSNTISSYTGSMFVYEEKAAQTSIDGIVTAISNFFAAIFQFLGSLFR